MEKSEQKAENAVIINSSISVDKFNDGYFDIHKHIVENGDIEESRNGKTFEILNFKTEIKNPLSRCVGGKSRNTNVFFLLAEAMWIWAGRRDVKFLEIFNSQMKDFSDNGVYFHAPYGWRLRNYGVHSMIMPTEENNHATAGGIDQIAEAIIALTNAPADRRVVNSIWNSEFDLGIKSKDIPCNDLLMWKIRKNKLHLTIQNRSNDLDWGLCTNVFQFSFILEIMANILNVEVGTQVHNSQSLHLYDWNALTKAIEEDNSNISLYDNANTPTIDFDFGDITDTLERMKLVDFWIKSIISRLLLKIDNNFESDEEFKDNLFAFSEFLYFTYNVLEIYIKYKNKMFTRFEALQSLYNLRVMNIAYKSDYLIMAMNFFVIRFESANNPADGEQMNDLITKIRTEIDANIGKY